MSDITLIILVFCAAVILGVIVYNMYQENKYRQQVREQFGHADKDALLGSKRIVNTLYGCEWLPLMREKIWQLKLLAGKNQPLAVRKDSKPETEFKPRQYR